MALMAAPFSQQISPYNVSACVRQGRQLRDTAHHIYYTCVSLSHCYPVNVFSCGFPVQCVTYNSHCSMHNEDSQHHSSLQLV
ncbi:hypothetical protein L798_00640 [Zootermopsis nevadensis]|uniref:Uncharacterized protein n=1 Tax=Zootermopsis nevadensis TaxID=136037 RepID=A0A067QXE5_ZOONE|nr:hypothetical protein L798_00640 [Zootermopsis nevadensis]